MKTTVKHSPIVGRVKWAACAIVAFLSTPAFAGDSTPEAYRMMVIKDEAYGRSIENGNHQQAIDKLARNDIKHTWRFSVNNNLCVAYTLSENIDKASYYCDRAVSTSAKANTNTWYSLWDSDRRNKAIALSNRGVLRAITGNLEGAWSDLKAANELKEGLTEVNHNLERYQLTSGGNALALNQE